MANQSEHPTENAALRFKSVGGDLEIVHRSIPALPANQILVQVCAASINPVDIQLWRSRIVGVVGGDKGMGSDFAGCVAAIGKDITGWEVGDWCFGLIFQVVSQLIMNKFHLSMFTKFISSLGKGLLVDTLLSIQIQMLLQRIRGGCSLIRKLLRSLWFHLRLFHV